jgi:hypothetical protein
MYVYMRREDGWEVGVNASMLEIYNEELRDILAGGTTTASHNEKDKKQLKISNLQGFVTVAGLTAVELDTMDLSSGMNQLEQLLEKVSICNCSRYFCSYVLIQMNMGYGTEMHA